MVIFSSIMVHIMATHIFWCFGGLKAFFNGHWLSLHSILRSNLVFSVSIVASSSSSQDYHPSVNVKVLRSHIKYRNSYNDLNALDKRVVSGTGTMAIGCWISLALLLCHITFSFCYLTSKSPSPWNLTLLFCCLLTRYTKILHLKSACPCLPCFAGYPNPNQVQDQRPNCTLYLHNKKDKYPYAYFYIVPFRPPPSSPKNYSVGRILNCATCQLTSFQWSSDPALTYCMSPRAPF